MGQDHTYTHMKPSFKSYLSVPAIIPLICYPGACKIHLKISPFLLPQKPCIKIPVKCQSVEDTGYRFIQLHIKPVGILNKLSVKNTEHLLLSDRPFLDNYNYITT